MIKTEIVSTRARCALERRYDVKHTPAVVRWDAGPLGVDYLCKRCLDDSLDFADDMRVGEPDSLTWVMTGDDHWCGRHWWPAVLCDDWSHGPFSDRFGQFVAPPSIARHVTVSRRQVGGFHPTTRGIDTTA